MAYLPGLLQFDERADRVGVGHAGVGGVHLVEVDHIHPQPTQALLALVADVVGRAHRGQRDVTGQDLGGLVPRLRGDHEIGGVGVQRLGDDLLRLAIPVDVGGVDEVHTPVDDASHELAGDVAVASARRVAGAGDAHRTEAEAAHRKVAADAEGADGVVGQDPVGHLRKTNLTLASTCDPNQTISANSRGLCQPVWVPERRMVPGRAAVNSPLRTISTPFTST